MAGADTGITAHARPALDRRDQVMTVVFGLWMVIGLFLDGWAHDHNKPESFFTPWHGVLYSGFVAAGSTALLIAYRARRPGRRWLETLPAGHGLTLAALALFAAGAAGDLLWHELLGVEVGVEALLSPTHLLLLVGGLVALSAPVRAAWNGDEPASSSLRSFAPTVLSLALLTALVGFFLLYLSPLVNDAAGTAFSRGPGVAHTHPSTDAGELQQLLGVASILMTSVLLAVPGHLLLLRWRRPPAGTFVTLFGVVIVLFVGLAEFAQPSLVLAGVAAGAVTDWLARRTVPPVAMACGVVTLWLSYFGLYALEEGSVAWSAELWAGTTLLAGLLTAAVGLLTLPVPGAAASREPS